MLLLLDNNTGASGDEEDLGQVNNTDLARPDPVVGNEGVVNKSGGVLGKAKSAIQNLSSEKFGKSLLGDKQDLMDGSPENRERLKELAKERARKAVSNQVGKRITNEAVKKGFEKGLSKSTGALAKEGVKKMAGKAAGKATAQATTKAATKAGAQAVTKGLQGAVSTAGAATGVETLGLGFLIAFLLNIAISLGVNDAVEAMFELKDGNFKKARFLAIRAAMKVGMFVVLLLAIAGIFSPAGIIIGPFIILFLDIYMILGILFPEIAIFQGFVGWEKLLIVLLNIFALIIFIVFLAGIAWYICNEVGAGSGGVKGALVSGVANVFDWWTGTNYATTVDEMCKSIKTF